MTVTISNALVAQYDIDETNQTWLLDTAGSITVNGGHGMFNGAAYLNTGITIKGHITADTQYKSGIMSDGAHASLKIDGAGVVHAYNGIAFYGDDTTAENFGAITAQNIGIYGHAENVDINNSGSITAAIGIYADISDVTTAQLENNGTIKGNFGIVTANTNSNITVGTSGVIDSAITGITLGGDSNKQNYIVNEGLITSPKSAIEGVNSKDIVINHGTIKGEIHLGGGNDTFDNRDGTIDHAVDGGGGDDTYVFGATAFTIVDSSGNDTIGTEITRTLASFSNMENLVLMGNANINGTGNALANGIYGNDGNNVLDGGVDAAIDTLVGGKGADTYVLRDGYDNVYESDSFGQKNGDDTIDTITSTISRSLEEYHSVENLKLIGGNLDGTGNNLANVITGTSGNNTLNGGLENSYGAQIDTLIGGAGNDTYVLDDGADLVVDTAGIDTIISTISRSLAGHATIENLVLGGGASTNTSATGNALANVITGTAGNNLLDGGVDTLVDTLDGGAGNDFYILGSGHDTVVDSAGLDTITSLVSRNLADYAGIENLLLKGDGNVNGTGNALANIISGTGGNNILDGGADNVVDMLQGDIGNDTYVLGSGYDIVSDGGGIDTITSTITRNLSNTSAIENLKLLGSSAIDGTGNTLSNTLTGNGAANVLTGLNGNDVLAGGAGADKLDGGDGVDTASYANAVAGVTVNLANTAANLGDAKGDSYVSIEKLAGSAFADSLSGTAFANTISGGAGADMLYGGKGADALAGGTGADTFVFKALSDSTVVVGGQDKIFDFSHAEGDKISLTAIDANTFIAGDQGFVFKGAGEFTGTKGELHYDKQASDTYVYGDVNGDKMADFVLHFDDAITFQGSDFLL